jgi:hypothetical protein
VLPEWRLITVDTRDYTGGRKTVADYQIHGNVKAFS